MESGPISVYLSLGSNLGDRQKNLDMALDYLAQRLRLEKVSSVYDTAPMENVDQPHFLNLVCHGYTRLPPAALLNLIKGIEGKLGRLPNSHNLPRTIDIDILFYGDQVIDTPELTIPHPKLTERAFVLIPLAEIAPDLVCPKPRKSAKDLLNKVGGKAGVVKVKEASQEAKGKG